MLEDLKVLNGSLSPKYDKYNNEYTVKIDNNTTKIIFDFVKDDNVNVSVYGNNNLEEGNNSIILLVENDSGKEYIYINAIKNNSAEVMSVINSSDNLEIANSAPIYAGSLIALSCFLIIFLMFLLMFKSKKTP